MATPAAAVPIHVPSVAVPPKDDSTMGSQGFTPAGPDHGQIAAVNKAIRDAAGPAAVQAALAATPKFRGYFAAGGATLNSSARWCFQNLAMPVVPWPRVSSLAGMST